MSQNVSTNTSLSDIKDKKGKVAVRTRPSLLELQAKYEKGDRKPLTDLMRAWKGIKELAPGDPHSFFNLAGFHGEPFSGAGYGDGVGDMSAFYTEVRWSAQADMALRLVTATWLSIF